MVNLHAGNRISLDVAPLGKLGTSTLSSQALTDKLSQAFSETLRQFGIDPSGVKLTIRTDSGPITGQPGGAGQVSVATASVATRGVSPVTVPWKGNTSKIGFNALVPGPDAPDPTPAPGSTKPPTHWYGADAVDDAYWSKQPAPVQQLREIDDMSQRQALATQLSGAGFQIDVPIMVWGWDAGKTTALRQSAGYSWVPSALQAPVTAAPGITGPGIIPYDPNNPPPGSIKV